MNKLGGKGKLKGMLQKKITSGDLLHVTNHKKIDDIKSLKEEENKIIEEVLDEIWDNFNDDGNEHLDTEEMEHFIYITLIESGVRTYASLDEMRNDESFNNVFK